VHFLITPTLSAERQVSSPPESRARSHPFTGGMSDSRHRPEHLGSRGPFSFVVLRNSLLNQLDFPGLPALSAGHKVILIKGECYYTVLIGATMFGQSSPSPGGFFFASSPTAIIGSGPTDGGSLRVLVDVLHLCPGRRILSSRRWLIGGI